MGLNRGDYVRIKDTADNFVGAIGRVIQTNETTCEVEVVDCTGIFLFDDLEPVGLRLSRERTYRVVNDRITMPWELNQVAKEFEAEGYNVQRAFGGTVVIPMPDGEIHFVPGPGQIKEYVFQAL